MNKKLLIGALALSTTALFGLVGCGDKKKNDEVPQIPPTPTYTVTFDHDNNPNTPAISEVEFEHGQTELDSVPNVPEMNGFAGVWNNYTLNNEDIVVTASYGDGTQENPFLVATNAQFKRILNNYTSYVDTTYLKNGVPEEDEAEASTKSVNYKTMSVIYTRESTTSAWTFSRYEIKNKVYFKLVKDVILSNISGLSNLDLSGRYFAGEIDGQGHSIYGLDGRLFTATEGSMFANVAETTFKNLNIYLGSNLGSIATLACGGNVRFENIKTYNTNGTPAIAWADDNNESAFLAHATGNAEVVFNSCTNNADFVSYAKNSGIFIGGYATSNTKVTFYKCINNGNIVSRGNVGLFFGSDAHKPKSYTIINCEHNGNVTALSNSHMLAPAVASAKAFGDELDDYDRNIAGEFSGFNDNSLSQLSTDYTATITDNDIEVSNAEVKEGKYQLVLSAYARNAQGATLLTNIIVEKTKEDTDADSIVFENAYLGLVDLNTYNASSLTNKIDSASLESSDWISVNGYNIRYFIDETNGLYVIDYSNHDDTLTINVNASRLEKTVIYTGNTIEFIVNFQTN